MTDASIAHEGRARHWLVDAIVGGGLALGLITVAHASLPDIDAGLQQKADLRRTAPSAAAPAAPAGPTALISFQHPLPGYVVGSPFGLRQLPWEEGGRLHAGVDIAAPAGEPIRAAADGVVIRVSQDGGYGRFVEVQHAEGLTTLYGHMGAYAPNIAPGMAVKAGDPVGRTGSTGTSTGAHLHFEIHDYKDRPLNPELFLGRTFATAEDLPLRKAQRIPRQVRVAYVSMIPKAKREKMEAEAEAEILAELEAEAAAAKLQTAKLQTVSTEASAVEADSAALAAGDAAKDAADGPKVIEVSKTLLKAQAKARVDAKLKGKPTPKLRTVKAVKGKRQHARLTLRG